MRTVSLLRHAKSSWDDPDLEDHERPLAKRGVKAASRIGAWMARERLRPQLVLCSDALRTRATLTLVLAEMGKAAPQIVYDAVLYLAEPAHLLARMHKVDGRFEHVLLIGHNPGLHALALALAASGKRKKLAALAARFPTASLAVIDCEAASWSSLGYASGRLRAFVTDADLR